MASSNTSGRRDFLRRGAIVGGGLAAGWRLVPGVARGAAPANERLVLGVVGIRSRGQTLATGFAERSDCRVAYLCDADTSLFAARAESIGKVQNGQQPRCLQDFRKALDDKAVDALVVATPDHWHCLATILACQAGKDVYVAAPLSHHAWEGQQAVEAVGQYRRMVTVGLETRSVAYALSAKKYLDEGKLGKIHLCRVFDQKGQSNFPAQPDGDPPATLDWDAWNGPAALVPYNVNYQNNWHGYWRYSGGDMAADGIHQLDLARWLCDVEYPKSVYAQGGRYHTDGANETPDTLVANYEFDGLLMTFELTLYTPYMMKIAPSVRNGDLFPYWPQTSSRIEIYGSEGVMLIGPAGAGWQVFARPRREQPVVSDRAYGHPVDVDHQENFVQSVRSRQPPTADIRAGHRSALLVHYANMSLRTGGQKLIVDPKTEHVNDAAAMKFFRRDYRKPWTFALS